MGPKLTMFQGVILGVFGVAIVAGVLFFATYASQGNRNAVGPVEVWGTLPERAFTAALGEVGYSDTRMRSVTYIQMDEATFDEELSEALAEGTGPDLFVMTQDRILMHESKVNLLPYSDYSQRTFRDTFIDVADLYLVERGIIALPIAVDPLVLYYNREMLAANGFANPPKDWAEVYTIAERVGQRDAAGGVLRGAIAFGEYDNVLNAKDIVSMLIMQAGGFIVASEDDGRLFASLTRTPASGGEVPALSALRFYTSFANPNESVYSWNRAQPLSRDAFAEGKTALYVGYASERPLIRELNPNLDYDVTLLPQSNQNKPSTFGRVYALAQPRVSQNPAGASVMMQALSDWPFAQQLSLELGVPSMRRDVLAGQFDGAELVFRNAALVADAWLDPDPVATNGIFERMIEGVSSGATRLSEAVGRADREIDSLLR